MCTDTNEGLVRRVRAWQAPNSWTRSCFEGAIVGCECTDLKTRCSAELGEFKIPATPRRSCGARHFRSERALSFEVLVMGVGVGAGSGGRAGVLGLDEVWGDPSRRGLFEVMVGRADDDIVGAG